jgi:hypothetical protein
LSFFPEGQFVGINGLISRGSCLDCFHNCMSEIRSSRTA